MAGGKVRLAVEFDDHAAFTYRDNFPTTPLFHGDISTLSVEEALKHSGLQPGELDILDGSPPCQGFSTAGARRFSDARNQLFQEYVRLLRGLKPKVCVMENVAGMVKGKMKLIFADCLKQLKESGYRVKAKLFDTSFFGVPQARKRLIFVGVREDLDLDPVFPVPKGPITNIMTAIEGADTTGTPPFNDSYAELYDKVPQGGSAVHVIGKGFNSCVKPDPNKPSPTLPKMQTGRGFATICHPFEKRALSIGEAKRLATFPDNFCFEGTYSQQWARIGNSVPPLFMSQIASTIRDNIFGNPKLLVSGNNLRSGAETGLPTVLNAFRSLSL
jgi:DNA (cytosine-5)-methyltransferase 1